MNNYTNEYFNIIYNECDKSYIDLIINELNKSYHNYLEFFNIKKLNQKIEIKFYDNIDEFKNYYEKTKNHPYKSGRVAIARDNEIHILSLKERLIERPNDSLDTLIMSVKHELVHICHIAYKGNNKGTWLAEGLATNLGSPRYEETLDGCSIESLLNKDNYKYCYTITKYMLDNYSKETILNYAKNDELLLNDTEKIFKEAKNYFNNKKN